MGYIYCESGLKIGKTMNVLNIENEIYTSLAKEGKLDELPDNCEFSEPVELEVWNFWDRTDYSIKSVIGKFKEKYIDENLNHYRYAKLPKSKFKVGDVVEVESESFGVFYGMIHTINERGITISFGKQSGTLRMITDVKSIKKLK